MTHTEPDTVSAFAPATVANVAAGFDVLGFALDGIGDRITVRRDPSISGVRIESIAGVVRDLPDDPKQNTATVALLSMLEACRPDFGLSVAIHKGIPLGSGMGGSAASAVGAVVAANALLPEPLSVDDLLPHALAGEQAASGAAHADNVGPCLYGGLTAAVADHPARVIRLPVPDDLVCVLLHPHLKVETRQARAALPNEIDLGTHVQQSMRLTGMIAGCFLGDVDLLKDSMVDLIAEPTRSRFIPGFADARAAALGAGALAFAIAGSGPSVFAWTTSAATGCDVEEAVRTVFLDRCLEIDSWMSPVAPAGARVDS